MRRRRLQRNAMVLLRVPSVPAEGIAMGRRSALQLRRLVGLPHVGFSDLRAGCGTDGKSRLLLPAAGNVIFVTGGRESLHEIAAIFGVERARRAYAHVLQHPRGGVDYQRAVVT